tara:strand:- start:1708 stop:2652 length:945 start_codon:yes stop_codon:yes gene_type:complete
MTYREMPGINQSRLKMILSDPRNYKEDTKIETDGLRFGSLVDCLILDEDNFEKKYLIAKAKEPTATLLEIFNKTFPHCNESQIEEIVNQQSEDGKYTYWGSTKDLEKRRKNWDNSEFWDYWKEKEKANKFILVSQEDYDKALNAKHNFRRDGFIAKLLREQEINTHVVLQFSYKEFNCKSELDFVLINHKDKTIQELDVKSSTSNRFGFLSDIKKYKYDFQRAFYNIGMKKYAEDLGYTLLLPMIIYVPSFSNTPCYLFEFEEKYISGLDYVDKYGNHVESVDSAFARLNWHLNNDLWEYPMDYYINGKFQVIL